MNLESEEETTRQGARIALGGAVGAGLFLAGLLIGAVGATPSQTSDDAGLIEDSIRDSITERQARDAQDATRYAEERARRAEDDARRADEAATASRIDADNAEIRRLDEERSRLVQGALH